MAVATTNEKLMTQLSTFSRM